MSYKVEFTAQAQVEAREAARWIAEYSPEEATLWYFDLIEAVESLENFPARCPLAPESKTFGTKIRHLLFGKYRVLFIIEDEAVYVLHVRHSARKPLTPDDED